MRGLHMCVYMSSIMKNKLAMVAAIWLSPIYAQSQPLHGIALKGGLNAATLNSENGTADATAKYGFSGGLGGYLQWPLSKLFFLGGQSELLYTARGTVTNFEGMEVGTIRQHYFDVVVALRPGARLGPASVYLLLGGEWNILLSASRTANGATDDVTDDLNRSDLALLIGIGGALHLPQQKLGPFRLDTVFLEARHDRGLIEISSTGAKNRTTSLMLGLSFALRSKTASR